MEIKPSQQSQRYLEQEDKRKVKWRVDETKAGNMNCNRNRRLKPTRRERMKMQEAGRLMKAA